MFKLADPDTLYSYPVIINVPIGGGKTAAQKFIAQFKLVPADDANKNLSDDSQYLATILFGWESISDHSGKPLKFNDKNRDHLAQIGYFSLGVATAYRDFCLGLPAKNSEMPSDIT